MQDIDIFPNFLETQIEWLREDQYLPRRYRYIPDHRTPCFITGFPRSGTTLLAQALSAHPEIIASNEEPYIGKVIECIELLLERDFSFPNDVCDLTASEIVLLRDAYWRFVADDYPEWDDELYFVDKCTLNNSYLVLIDVIFPEAEVINMIRDPRDVCSSASHTHFTDNLCTIHLDDFDSTAKIYTQVMDLYLSSRRGVDIDIEDVSYEFLVADFKTTIKGVLKFFDIPWSDDVLNYHKPEYDRKLDKNVFGNITKPVFTSSIGRWKREKVVNIETIKMLEPYIKYFGYSF